MLVNKSFQINDEIGQTTWPSIHSRGSWQNLHRLVNGIRQPCTALRIQKRSLAVIKGISWIAD